MMCAVCACRDAGCTGEMDARRGAFVCELAARGYIQRDEVKGGGRPMKYIYVNPELMQERSETL